MLKPLIFLSLVAAPAPAIAAPKAPETLTRTGNWVVNYDRDACHLLAEFGTGDDLLVMRLTRYQPGDAFDLNLYGRRLVTSAPRTMATLDFGPGAKPIETEAVNGRSGKLPLVMLGRARLDGWRSTGPDDDPPPLPPAQEAAVSGVTVKIDRKKPFRLEFGSLAKPMAQLRTCQADLVKSWGYDPVVQAGLSRPVRRAGPAVPWLRDTDYPMGAIAMGHNGIVQFRLDVEADGRISGCHVLARTSPDVFADTTCRAVMRRAKLDPALDAQGRPVRSFFVQKVTWQVQR